jgi:HSP20 family protein
MVDILTNEEVNDMAEERKDRDWLPIRYFGPMSPRLIAPSSLFHGMERLLEEFNEEFDYPLWPSMLTSPPRFPAVDVKEEEDQYVVMADLPGISKEEVNILVGDGVLDISAKRQRESEEEKEGYVRKERGYYSFHRRLTLPEDADEEGVDAKLEDGVLKLSIPKKKEEKETKKKVEVK